MDHNAENVSVLKTIKYKKIVVTGFTYTTQLYLYSTPKQVLLYIYDI